MAATRLGFGSMLLVLGIILVVMPGQAAAFGAGNIPSIAQVEGHNWRHGDIEDMLSTVAFLGGKKWTTLMIKRVYMGNWLRGLGFSFPRRLDRRSDHLNRLQPSNRHSRTQGCQRRDFTDFGLDPIFPRERLCNGGV